jgi:hypothetical protein
MLKILLRIAAVSLCMFVGVARGGQWTVGIDEKNGLPEVSLGGAAAVTSNFVFWGNKWAWAGLESRFRVTAPYSYLFSGRSQRLDFDLSARIAKEGERQFIWEFDLDAHSSKEDVIGGGISFKFDLASFGSELGEPELLADNRGWIWGRIGGPRMEMRFEPSLATVFFERGWKSEARAYFFKDVVPQGQRHYVATLTLEGIATAMTTAERFGIDDAAAWSTEILNPPIAPWTLSPVDLSFLNASERPAGKRGFLKPVGDKLIFEDGTPVRFWGTNIAAHALFGTDRENVRRQARRLSQLGFNLVRLTHLDSKWVQPNVLGDGKSEDTRNVSELALERLDWWIKCLKDEGIYVWLDLQVGREFKVGDNIQYFDEVAKGKSTLDLKGYNYVNPSMQEAMRRFNNLFVNHFNSFTGLRYRDDPAVISFLLTNENDLTHHFGNRLLPDKNVPLHNSIYMKASETFAATYGLAKDKVWRSWEQGPSKLFLNDVERRFNVDMMKHLRTEGVKAPIVTTSTFGGNPLSSLPALTEGDFIAVHSYGAVGALEKNPVYAANLVHWMAGAQIVDRPLVVSEWNVEPFPTPDRHAIPLYVASSAALQGWDGVLQYAYSQQPLVSRGRPSNWHAFNDPALIATLPAAALLYRRNDVREATTTYVYSPTADQLFNTLVSPGNSPALRTASEMGKLVIAMPSTRELPWLQKSRIPSGAKIITNPKVALLEKDAKEVVSDTRELRRNWEEGIFTIDTPRTQAAMGWLGGRQIRLADVEIELSTRNATVAVQSLDGNGISNARALMVSLGARSVPKSPNDGIFNSEPVSGHLIIRAQSGLKVYKHDGVSNDQEVPASYSDGRYRIELGARLGTYWLVLK